MAERGERHHDRAPELAEGVEETVAILGLLHDVCDPLPLGHGEKSLYLIQRHMDLEPEEALAIRWHMGAYDSAVKGGARDMGAAMEMSPWVWRLQQADMCATFVDEREEPEE